MIRVGLEKEPTAAAGGPAPRLQSSEELADVVIADGARHRRDQRCLVRLRAWLFCALFLAAAEMGARFAFDRTLCLHHERFDNFPNAAALDAYIRQIRADRALRIVVIGDSVVVGPSLLDKDETIPEYLETELRRRFPQIPIDVWNLGIAGARGSDERLMLQRLLEAKPDFVIIESNLMVFTQGLERMPLANKWLAFDGPPVPPDIARYVPARDVKQRIDDAATAFVERNVRMFGLRQAINGMLFGVQPRSPIETPNPLVMSAAKLGKRLGRLKMASWRARGVDLGGFSDMYSHAVNADNLNCRFMRSTLAALRESGTPGFAYLTPQNPVLAQRLYKPYRYASDRAVALASLSDSGTPERDYSNLLPETDFYDNDHLLAQGNRALALQIAEDIAPQVDSILAGRGRAGE